MKILNPASAINFSSVYQNNLKEESKLRDCLKGGRLTIVPQTNRNKDNPLHLIVKRPPKSNNKNINGIENKYETKPVAHCFDLFSKSHHKENIYLCDQVENAMVIRKKSFVCS